ncbi:D-amino acid dehydrogenase small subunit [Aquisphaera giovannonii]|uniref:D-amino acid dehydrogenase small subunit n=1 Tax=Aquisphaera giovannonii TaxID=406548 RepID=A0A5B9W4I2_9BACT|nr:FAD-dependent oxidoreductase [Aquisphaera giovannonii]QEH35137.1 D-amino acid dehydrogenase small subunit [Aquisphaera giovannonii]
MTATASDEDRVVIVGGGVVGAFSAYYLAKAGHAVTVVDAGPFGGACSRGNCGYICPSHVLPLAGPGAIGTTLRTMMRKGSPIRIGLGTVLSHPGWFLRFARNCNEAAMMAAAGPILALTKSSRALYDEVIAAEDLDCEWDRNGLLFVFRTRAAMDHYAEVDHLLRERFDTPARRLDGDALAAFEPALKPGLPGGWLYEGDAQLRPDRLMAELKRVLEGLGVSILENRKVTGFLRQAGRAAGVRTDGGEIPAGRVVVATGAWTPGLARELGCKVPIQPGKGYSVTYPRPEGSPGVPMIFEEDRVAVSPFHSGFRIGSMMELVGPDASLDPRRLGVLTETANRYLKPQTTGAPEDSWWGWRPMTPDGLPLIGAPPATPNVLVAAGHNMLGMTMGPATGKLVAELVGGEAPHIDPAPYAVGRF